MATNDIDPKKSEFKFVTKSIQPKQAITTNFENILKCHNDSSLDEVLEFRSLLSDSFKIDQKSKMDGLDNDIKNEKDKSYSGEVQQFIQKIL